MPLLAVAVAAALATPICAGAATLQATVDSIAKRAPMDHAQLGVFAIEASTGRVLARNLADQPLAPASTFKILLSAAALDTLGPQFRFRTHLLMRGSLNGSRLD